MSETNVLYRPSANVPTGVWMGSGKKCAKAKVSEASPLMMDPSPVAADESEGLTRKKRRYTHAVMKPKYARNMAVSVPRTMPDMVFARRNMAGKCLTRMRMRPFAMATVCSGTSCLKETRKPA